MKKLFFFPALAVCVFADLFFSSLICYAMLFREGIINLDFNYFHEGWVEGVFFGIVGVIGSVGLFYLFKKWFKDEEKFLRDNKFKIAIILCAISFFLVTAIFLFIWILIRG